MDFNKVMVTYLFINFEKDLEMVKKTIVAIYCCNHVGCLDVLRYVVAFVHEDNLIKIPNCFNFIFSFGFM